MAKESKQQRWNKAHPEKLRVASDRSAAKRFIRTNATVDELSQLENLIKERRGLLARQLAEVVEPLNRYARLYSSSNAEPPKGFDIIESAGVLTASFEDKFLVNIPTFSKLDPYRESNPFGETPDGEHLKAWRDWSYLHADHDARGFAFTVFPLSMRSEVEKELNQQFSYQPILKVCYSAAALTRKPEGPAFYYPGSQEPVITWVGEGRGYWPAIGTKVISGDLSLNRGQPWDMKHPPLLESEILRQDYARFTPAEKLVYVLSDEAPKTKPRTYHAIRSLTRKGVEGKESVTSSNFGTYKAFNKTEALKAFRAEHPHSNIDNIEIVEV